MSVFEEALRKTVEGVDKGFRAAHDDLQEAVGQLSVAVSGMLDTAQLALSRVGDANDDTYYDLDLYVGKHIFEIASFRLSPQGYPIVASKSSVQLRNGMFEARLSSKDAITQYLLKLTQNPDSALVLRLTMMLRERERQRRRQLAQTADAVQPGQDVDRATEEGSQ